MTTTPPRFHAAPALSCVAALAVSVAVRAQATETGADALDQRLGRLEAEIAAIHARRAGPLAEARAEEIRAMVADVLDDADTRMSLLDDQVLAGYDDEFFIDGADGNFRLEISGQVQLRYVSDARKRRDSINTDSGFETRRTKLKFDGHVFSRDLGFTIGTAFNDSGGELRLQSFNIRYRLSPELRIYVGRARPPLLREEQVSSKRQVAAERSLVANTFDQTRTLGVQVRYQDDRLRIDAGAMDAQLLPVSPNERWRLSTRIVTLLTGEWDALDDLTSFPDDELTVALGGGVFYQTESLADPTANEVDLFRWSVDLTVELGGAHVFAYFVSSRREEETVPTRDQYGWVVQGGYFFKEEWEIFGRYEAGDADGAALDLSVATVGVNYYIREHALKATLDVGYGLNPVDDFWATGGAGWNDDRPTEDGQVVTRLQFQLLF